MLGKRIRDLRKGLGITQAKLASRCGTDQSTISRIERGDAGDLRAKTLAKLATALHTTTDSLLGRKLPFAQPDFRVHSSIQPDKAVLQQQVETYLAKSKIEGDVHVFFHTEEVDGEFVTMVQIKVREKPGRGRRRITGPLAERIVQEALAHPKLGCDRLAYELKSQGIHVGSTSVQNTLTEHQLNTRYLRAQHLLDQTETELTTAQKSAIDKVIGRSTQRETASGSQ